MLLEYLPSETGSLCQGEILEGVAENTADYPACDPPDDTEFGVVTFVHGLSMVMSPACDLEWDFKARFPTPETQRTLVPTPEPDNPDNLLPAIILCDVFEHAVIRPRFEGKSDIFRRIKGNHDVRYHHLDPASVGEGGESHSDLYMDFKKVYGVQADKLYDALREGDVQRCGVMPPFFVHELVQRFYSYRSRFGIPD